MIDVKQAIEQGEERKSKIPRAYISNLTGLSSPKVWHTLNNLASQSKNYLEIGTYLGSSLMAAAYGNEHLNIYACDNFCMKPKLRNHFYQNVKNIKHTFLEKDCFEITREEVPEPIELLFFDGRHEYQDQYKALEYFLPFMTEEFIYVCDDWTNGPVKSGTRDAIRDLGLEVVEEYIKGDGKLKDVGGWWCGAAFFRLRKSKLNER